MDLQYIDHDPWADPALAVEIDLHSVDSALDHLRTVLSRTPHLWGAYREDFAEIAAEFQQLAQS